MKFRNRKLILLHRIFAVKDVLLSRRFEINTFYADGRSKTKHRFDKSEILQTDMSSLSKVKKYLSSKLDD
jgi:hypothetical protein